MPKVSNREHSKAVRDGVHQSTWSVYIGTAILALNFEAAMRVFDALDSLLTRLDVNEHLKNGGRQLGHTTSDDDKNLPTTNK